MQSLYEIFKEFDYPLFANPEFSDETAEKIIKDIFESHGKGNCFLQLDTSKYNLKRTFHSVSVYLIGLYLLKNTFIGKNPFRLKNSKDFKFESKLSIHIAPETNYIWLLSSLYHDVVTNRENFKVSCLINSRDNIFITPISFLNYIDFFNQKLCYSIFSDSFGITEITKNINAFESATDIKPTYDEKIVNAYFRKRLGAGYIDHGIASGFVFYDALVKNYLEKLSKKISKDFSMKLNEEFLDENLVYRPEHLLFFKYIANAIIVHNIWRYDENTIVKYAECDLLDEKLMSGKNLFSLENNPLVFLLCLVDTIEPTKFFHERFNIEIEDILKDIEIEVKDNSIYIQLSDSLKFPNQAKKDWCGKLKSLEDWLAVKIEIDDSKKIAVVKY